MRFQPVYDIAELCYRKNVRHAVLCPGSRCAPLTLAFARHPHIDCKTISDERSAGYVALGMAQSLREPVVIVCTSGTAVYNLAPAVAEAFFSETPLIVLTADRPSEWVAQHDGQTIFQHEIFGRHVKRFFQLPQDYSHGDSQWAINRMLNEAINISRQQARGPVHVNAPFREPLYPGADESITFSADVRVIDAPDASAVLSEEEQRRIRDSWGTFQSVLVVAGQHHPDAAMTGALKRFAEHHHIPVVADIISNQHGVSNHIQHADLFLGQLPRDEKKALQPGLLITFGQSVISKNVKLFLRHHPPRAHWHIQEGGLPVDTFKTLTHVFRTTPENFFRFLHGIPVEGNRTTFLQRWANHSQQTNGAIAGFFTRRKLSEMELVASVLRRMPAESNLHLANSMSVRYANIIDLPPEARDISVYSNRGTSGIDGCSSTAVGHCLATAKPTFLITGDLAFFYDRNAFWHNYSLETFRAVVLNNHGGLIFNVIDGPAAVPEAAEYFITRQPLNAKKLCEEFNFVHIPAGDKARLADALTDFFTFDGRAKILELEGDVHVNRTIFDQLKTTIRNRYES